jgi:V/A-type H+-transporting ATPase subunit G/H
MELIKKIKQAEAQAQEIIEQARIDATEQAEKGRENRRQVLADAEQHRKISIEAAIAKAQALGRAEVEKLKAQAERQRQELRDKTSSKMATATTKVMDYLRG